MVLVGHYHFGTVLGRGKFGWVSQATHNVVGECVAIKHQPWGFGGETCGGDGDAHTQCQHAEETQWRAALENEAQLLARISHPCVVALLEVVRLPSELYVCLEYLGKVTLASLVSQEYENNGSGLCEPEAACIFKQVAAGLHHLHCENILHRDVKPENIMVVPGQDSQLPVAKLIDLGLAALWDPSSPLNTACTRAGTVTYMAPELTSSCHAYGPEVDVFSLGASMYYALTGEVPFIEYTRNGKRGTTALFGLQIHHEEALDAMTTNAASLLRSMLNTNPDKRCTLSDVSTHDWILQEYSPPKIIFTKFMLRVDCLDSINIAGLFNNISGEDSLSGKDKEFCEEKSDGSENLSSSTTQASLVSNISSVSNSSLESANRVRIRSLSHTDEDIKDVLINMECVDRVSLLLQKDNDHILQHLGDEPWGPVGGVYNLLLCSGLI